MKSIEIQQWKITKWVAELRGLQNKADTEAAHIYADEKLCEILDDIGLSCIAEEFRKIRKWYS